MNKELQEYYKQTKNASSNSELWNIIVNLVKEKQEKKEKHISESKELLLLMNELRCENIQLITNSNVTDISNVSLYFYMNHINQLTEIIKKQQHFIENHLSAQ